MKKQTKPTRYAPRLEKGCRDFAWMTIPDAFKEALRAIARMEGKSMSWVAQEVLIDFCHRELRVPLPRYRKRREGKVLRYPKPA
jgi:hypothetical protein